MRRRYGGQGVEGRVRVAGEVVELRGGGEGDGGRAERGGKGCYGE